MDLPRDFTCSRQECGMMRPKHFYSGGAIGGQAAAQERNPFLHITIFNLGPAVTDRSVRAPEGETLLGRDCNHLVYPFAWSCGFSGERKHGAPAQGHNRRRRMSQPPRLDDGCVAPCHCLLGIAETKQGEPQDSL